MTGTRRASDERTRKSVRLWIISRREAAAALKLSDRQFAALVESGFIKPTALGEIAGVLDNLASLSK